MGAGVAVELQKAVLSCELLRDWADEPVVKQQLERTLNVQLQSSDLENALQWLSVRGLVERSGATRRVRFSEPDCAESDLYLPLFDALQAPSIVETLGLEKNWVLQDTSRGGPRDGRLSRPDFTLAAIRSWTFDPQSTLEVYSFEVKNRAGASVGAVFEAVAHGRLVHHSYLVCPRSKLFPKDADDLRHQCDAQGVGLALFDLERDASGYHVRGLAIEVRARRRSPDPAVVEKYLEARLSQANAKLLRDYARSVR
jgi:hypothetical protein